MKEIKIRLVKLFLSAFYITLCISLGSRVEDLSFFIVDLDGKTVEISLRVITCKGRTIARENQALGK